MRICKRTASNRRPYTLSRLFLVFFLFLFVRIFFYVKIIGKCVKNIISVCVQVKFSFSPLCISFLLVRFAATTELHSIIINTKIIKFITLSYCARVHSVCTPNSTDLPTVDRQREREWVGVCICMQRVSANANDANRCAIARHTLSTRVLLLPVVLNAVAAVCMHFVCFSTLAHSLVVVFCRFFLRYCSYRCMNASMQAGRQAGMHCRCCSLGWCCRYWNFTN